MKENYLFEKLTNLQNMRDISVTTPGCTSGIERITHNIISEMDYTRKEIELNLAHEKLKGTNVAEDIKKYSLITGIVIEDIVRSIKWQIHIIEKKKNQIKKQEAN